MIAYKTVQIELLPTKSGSSVTMGTAIPDGKERVKTNETKPIKGVYCSINSNEVICFAV